MRLLLHALPLRRLVTVQHTGAGQLSAEVGSVEIEDAPLRMALSPGALVLALAKGGLQRFDLQRNNPEGPPALTPPPGAAPRPHSSSRPAHAGDEA